MFLTQWAQVGQETSLCCRVNEWPLLDCFTSCHDNRGTWGCSQRVTLILFPWWQCKRYVNWLQSFLDRSENVHLVNNCCVQSKTVLHSQVWSGHRWVITVWTYSALRPNQGSLCQRRYNLCQQACWPLSRYFTEPLGIFMSSLDNTETPPNNPLKYHSVIHWTPGIWSIMTGYLTRSEQLLKSCLVVYSLRNGKTPPHNNIGSSLALILERCVRAGERNVKRPSFAEAYACPQE